MAIIGPTSIGFAFYSSGDDRYLRRNVWPQMRPATPEKNGDKPHEALEFTRSFNRGGDMGE